MTVSERLDALKSRHAGLEAEISAETKRPNPDEIRLHALKKEKLKLKDEIAALERNTVH